MNNLFYYCAFCSLLVSMAICSGQTGSTNQAPRTPHLKPEAVLLMGDSKTPSLADLNRTAVNFLHEKGKELKSENTEVIVHIFAKEGTTLCEFFYFQGFGQPCWRVKVGTDGKVQNFTEEVPHEGTGRYEKELREKGLRLLNAQTNAHSSK